MIDQTQIKKTLEFFNLSKQAFLIVPDSNNPDLLLSAVAEYIFLQNLIKLGPEKFKLEELKLFAPKKIVLFKKWPKLNAFLKDNQLFDDLQTKLGKDNLVVSFPYQEDQVDKVSYHIGEDSQRFYLTIKPKKGQSPLDSKLVEYSYAGAEVDLLLLFGVGDLENLEQLYFGYEDLYQKSASITINTYIPDFGSLNLDVSGSCAYAEAVFYSMKSLLTLLDLEMADLEKADLIATLLFSALSLKTKNFSSAQMRAESFLAIAELMKLGARRLDLSEVEKDSKKESKPAKKKALKKDKS